MERDAAIDYEIRNIELVLAQLRHLHVQLQHPTVSMAEGRRRDSLASGLLDPQIKKLEGVHRRLTLWQQEG